MTPPFIAFVDGRKLATLFEVVTGKRLVVHRRVQQHWPATREPQPPATIRLWVLRTSMSNYCDLDTTLNQLQNSLIPLGHVPSLIAADEVSVQVHLEPGFHYQVICTAHRHDRTGFLFGSAHYVTADNGRRRLPSCLTFDAAKLLALTALGLEPGHNITALVRPMTAWTGMSRPTVVGFTLYTHTNGSEEGVMVYEQGHAECYHGHTSAQLRALIGV